MSEKIEYKWHTCANTGDFIISQVTTTYLTRCKGEAEKSRLITALKRGESK